MDSGYRKANILFLRGITLDDVKAAMETLEKKFLQHYSDPTPQILYNAMPERFRGMDSWPRETNLKCWQCDCTFKSMPWFMPSDLYRDRDGMIVMDPHGVFCTPNCVQAYIELRFKGEPGRYDKERNLRILVKMVTGKTIEKIIPSPDKTKMEQYCGNGGITYSQYRKMIDDIAADYELVGNKMEHMAFGRRVI